MLKDDFSPLDIVHSSTPSFIHTCPQLRQAVNNVIGREGCPITPTAHRLAVLLVHNSQKDWPEGWGCYEFVCRNPMNGRAMFDYKKTVSIAKAYKNPELLCKVKTVPGIHEDDESWEFKWV